MEATFGALSLTEGCINLVKELHHRVDAYRKATKYTAKLFLRVDNIALLTESLVKSLGPSLPHLEQKLQELSAKLLVELRSVLEAAIAALESFRAPTSDEQTHWGQSWGLSKTVSSKIRYMALEGTLKRHVDELDLWFKQFKQVQEVLALDPGFRMTTATTGAASNEAVDVVERIRRAVRLASSDQDFGDRVLLPTNALASEVCHVAGSSCIQCRLRDSPNGTVIVEETSYPPTVDRNVVLKYVCQLAMFLRECEPETIGLLRCLGVIQVQSGQFQILYAEPPKTSARGALRGLLAQNASSLDNRFLLATSMARSVMAVHTASMVHKSIRPENLLIFTDDETQDPQAYLVGFQTFRPVVDETSGMADMLWERNLYRHPQRQGIGPDEMCKYTMQHDIYSLGVCLLEIGLWQSFVLVEFDGSEEVKVPHPDLGIGDDINMSNKTKAAMVIKAKLFEIARAQLPARMGKTYTEIVLSCLKCLDKDGNMYEEGDNQEDRHGVIIGVRFIEKVLSKLDAISI